MRDSPHSTTDRLCGMKRFEGAGILASSLLRNLRSGMRLAVLQRIQREDFVISAEAFAALVVANLVALFLLGFAGTGVNGQFNYFELPRALLPVPLLLVFGLLVARANGDREAMLALAVALMAAGTTIAVIMGILGLLMQHPIAAGLGRHLWRYIYYFTFAWWAAVIVAAILRLAPTDLRRRTGNVVFGLVLLVVPAWLFPQSYLWMPAYDPESIGSRSNFPALAEEKGFYAQHEALSRALEGLLPERPGIVDLYLVAAGLYAPEDVFMKEVEVIARLFRERFDAEGRTLVLINNPKTVEEHPVASLTSLSAALRHVGTLINPEEDVVVLYASSHGSDKHLLSVDFWPLRLESIDPPALKRALDESGIKWKVVVVSACYSGGFVDPLKNEHTAVITASSAGKQSFGCGNDSEATYLAKALFDEELRKTYSFETAFENARKSIEQRERGQGYAPSEPQIHVGSAIRDKLAEIERRLAARAVRPSQ